jgi:hypothetical protein
MILISTIKTNGKVVSASIPGPRQILFYYIRGFLVG